VRIEMDGTSDIPITLRPFHPADQPACQDLYRDGLLGGQLADNDTGWDIDDIAAAYTSRPGNCFLVAQDESGRVVGMVGVQHHDEGTGEVRRLRVRRECQRRGIGSKLLEAALAFCQEHSYLKVTLDTYMDRDPAVRLFEKFRFRHQRTRTVGGKELMYFYLDLYTGQPRQE
jgi:ribosomal protein S18 acetylase RimI-like enzyme